MIFCSSFTFRGYYSKLNLALSGYTANFLKRYSEQIVLHAAFDDGRDFPSAGRRRFAAEKSLKRWLFLKIRKKILENNYI